jgi:hypothetical protein
LRNAIKDHIEIQGFRRGKAHQAPPEKIKRTLLKFWSTKDELIEAVIEVWAESHRDLLDKCFEWCKNKIDFQHYIQLMDNIDKTREKRLEEYESVIMQFYKEVQELGSEMEIRLVMAICIHQLVKIAEENDKKSVDKDNKMKRANLPEWHCILTIIENIPASDERWDSFESFILEIQAIHHTKQQQRNIDEKQNQFLEIFNSAQPQITKWANFFQIDSVDSWQPKDIQGDSIEQVIQNFSDLNELINSYQQLVNQPQPATLLERSSFEKQRDGLEEKILSFYKILDKCFSNQQETKKADQSREYFKR